VLSSMTGARTLEQTAEPIRHGRRYVVILTKLDEVPRRATCFRCCVPGGLPLSYLTDGQNVPDDI